MNLELAISESFVEELARRVSALVSQPPRAGWLNSKSAAAYLDTTEEALRARVKRDEIPFHRRDGRLYFSPVELDRYVLEGTVRT